MWSFTLWEIKMLVSLSEKHKSWNYHTIDIIKVSCHPTLSRWLWVMKLSQNNQRCPCICTCICICICTYIYAHVYMYNHAYVLKFTCICMWPSISDFRDKGDNKLKTCLPFSICTYIIFKQIRTHYVLFWSSWHACSLFC